MVSAVLAATAATGGVGDGAAAVSAIATRLGWGLQEADAEAWSVVENGVENWSVVANGNETWAEAA
jgi:hypothetical protein